MGRGVTAEIDLSAIVHNMNTLRAFAGGVQCIGIVKADGYGHGAVRVSQTLRSKGVEILAVALVEEAEELRAADVPGRILVLGYPAPRDAETLVALELESVVSDLAQAKALNRAAESVGKQATVHVKMDTGMGRIGVPLEDAARLVSDMTALPHVRVVGAMTHFPSSDEENGHGFTLAQIAAFSSLREELTRQGLVIPLWHACNSAGILYFPEARFDAVRPGVALYGSYPAPGLPRPVELRQALTLKARIARIREMPTGATVSYGRTFTLKRPSRIATLPLGYADGYDRRHSNRSCVLVHGRRAPIAGRVCMDLILVDVTDIPEARPGDEAVLYGRQGDAFISIEEAAIKAGTIPNEIMTSLGKRVPRVYVGA